MEPLPTSVPPPSSAPPPAARRFSAGDVIGRSFSVWFRNFVPFSIVALAVNVPVFALTALAPAGEGSALELLDRIVSSLAGLVVTGALTYGVLQALRGTPVPVGALFGKGFAKLGSVLLVSIGFGLAVFVGLVLLVIPGLVALAALYVAVPAVVVEPVGPGEALGRSRALTKGSRWGVFVVALVVGLVTVVAVAVATNVILYGASALPHPIAPLVSTVILVLASPLSACATAVAYHDLRVAKEGVDTEALVKVFE